MSEKTRWITVIVMCMLTAVLSAREAIIAEAATAEDESKLLVVWTSGDRDVALKMVFLYTLNAKKQGWFDRVHLLTWGPSAKLLANDRKLQTVVQTMRSAGVELSACKACADSYEVSEKLRSLGIEVIYMGKPLSNMLQGDWKVITF